MIWLLLSFLSAIMDAAYYALNKKFVKNIDKYVLAAGVFLSCTLFSLIAFAFTRMPEIKPMFYFGVFATAFLNVIAAILYLKALKISPLSLTMPMMSFTPLFLLITSPLIMKESPSGFGLIGIFLIVIGSYVLNIQGMKKGFLEPFKVLFKEKGIIYMLIVAVIYSFAANFDKMIVVNSNPVFANISKFFIMGLVFTIILFFRPRKILKQIKPNLKYFLLIGLVLAAVTIVVGYALSLAIVPYVISIKRTNILFSVLFGFWFFKEKNIQQRLLGAFIMFLGILFISLF